MTEFVFGLGPGEKSEYVLQRMRRSLKQGRRVVLIVPEQQVLTWDRRCAQSLPACAMLQAEVVSFTRLADSVFRRFGGVAKRYITACHVECTGRTSGQFAHIQERRSGGSIYPAAFANGQ